MERKAVQTKDASTTLYVAELDEHYHSIHGAVQESQHVFLDAGLAQKSFLQAIRILEFGFGTGLNALLTALYAEREEIEIYYHGLEKYPLSSKEWPLMDYPQHLGSSQAEKLFPALHQTDWEDWASITENFNLRKEAVDFKKAELPKASYHLVYFDAFAPSAQADLWTTELFHKVFEAMQEDGILVTYCVKGWVRRNMIEAGFEVEKIPGPPGKREMARARKPISPKL